MAKKRLFNKMSSVNDPGDKVATEVREAIKPIVDKYLKKGYCPRDLQLILSWQVEHEIVFTHAIMEAEKAQKKKK